MEYGTKYNFGQAMPSGGQKTETAPPTVGGFPFLDAKTKGRRRNRKGQKALRTEVDATDCFLRNVFLPKLMSDKTSKKVQGERKLEGDFYRSLSMVSEHYGISAMPTSSFDFPYNVALGMWDLRKRLSESVEDIRHVELVSEDGQTFISTEQRYDTGRTLYYIPVVPLYAMIRDRGRKHWGLLLLSVCSYLYSGAYVPYYRNDGYYLEYIYDMLGEWEMCDDEEDDPRYGEQIRRANLVGDLMRKKLENPKNLETFPARLEYTKRRSSGSEIENDCIRMAERALALYREYPNESIHRNAMPAIYDMEESDEDEYPISMEMYLSFCAETEGNLFHHLVDVVNAELNERYNMEEPIICKYFDGKGVTGADLDFERRLFPVIDELIYILHNLKIVHEKYN